MIAQELGERITRMFNFIYEVKGDYYILGRGYFRLCTDIELGVYKEFKDAFDSKEEDVIIERYKRVREYTDDCKPSSRSRDREILEFIKNLGEGDLKTLNTQVSQAEFYVKIAY